jgi:hypothetical protein
MAVVAGIADVAKKKTDGSNRRHGTLIRLSDQFAEALGEAARFENMAMGDFADKYLLSVVRKRYREAVLKEAKRLEDEAK